ncbi:MAG: heme ABC exporter ATP-binding protein CcmA [Rhizobiales bacterium]|nr:heme ABC exporter ATP-binding protein CcmA [Hyphomicrobiales bacterium]
MKLVAETISVNRGIKRVVQDLSFEVEQSEALIVTGENGAGKSTLLRAIAGLLPLDSGSVDLQGGKEELLLREQCHYLGHQNGLKTALSVKENLEFWQNFSGEPDFAIQETLEIVGLAHTLDLPVGYLSTGMKRRIAIAKLLITRKQVWIVDEPTAGLDGASSKMFIDICSAFCDDGGILIAATHLPLDLKKTKSLHVEMLDTYADDAFDSGLDT